MGDEPGVPPSDPRQLAVHPPEWPPRRAAGRLGTALWEVFPAHVALLDRDGVVVSVNRAWRQFGLSNGANATAGLGANYLQVCDRAAENGVREAAEAAVAVRRALAGEDSSAGVPYPCDSDTEARWFTMRATPVPGRFSGALVVHTDVTAERQREAHWQHRALHDPLTGLPNRALLSDRLEHAIAVADRDLRSLAVLMIGIDDFTSVNDSFDRATGDHVLTEVAARMARSVRSADTLGRWGGDEFLVIAERLDAGTTARDVADRLSGSVTDGISIGSLELTVSVSVGAAHLDSRQTAEELVHAADVALQVGRRRSGTRAAVPQ